MENKYIIITTVCNRKEIADKIIETLLEKRLVSCCQLMNISSSYWWKGKIEKEPELFIQMKTKKSLFSEVKEEILKIHDYEVCEILSYDITNGNGEFLKWIETETK